MENKKRINPLWNVIKTEWRYLGDRKKIFVLYMSLFVIAGAISLLNPLVVGLIFNSIQQTISSGAELKKLIFMIFILLALTIGFWIFHGAGRILEELTGFQVQRNYTNSKIRKVLELPVKWHKDHHSGDTIDKINRGREAIGSFSEYGICSVIYAVLNIFGSLIILFFIDKKIAVFAMIFSFLVLFIIIKIDTKLYKYYKELNKYSNKLSSAIFDYLSNILTVITLRLKKIVSRKIDDKFMAACEINKKSVLLNEFKWSFASISISLMTVLALSYRAYSDYYGKGIILIGTLYMLYGYLRTVGNTFFEFANRYGTITKYDARIRGAYPIDEAFENIEGKIKGKLPYGWEEVELRNIDFVYDNSAERSNLDKVNIKFKKGQKIALVGESGSGKSTILSLLRGLYLPDKGDVYVDGLKISNGIDKLKRDVTLIPQDPEIFNNTIRYNITMDLKTSKEDLDEVVKMARFGDVIDRLDKGLSTNVLEKGVSLSGGEKQRLALARGLLAARKSDIVLLDEPTSSVDSLNEMKIHDSIFEKFRNKTIISSIHRLHLLGRFDYIYMFERGKVVAEGSLDEIKKNFKFGRIWRKYGIRGQDK
ncbi:ABC transporter ATP-binding protein [Candidatus Pacearchaeota archaeon]|nr:ABC transporter ATP-binding protein [Candidatus Pacearchaeota archaeon]